MFAVNGILFNHESERRGETFVTRKITLAAARIAQGFQDKLYLGNLDARRDWGYAKDYIECMWLILQHDTPKTSSLPPEKCIPYANLRHWHFKGGRHHSALGRPGSGREGYRHTDRKSPRGSRPQIFPACRSGTIAGRPTKAKTLLGWNPRQTSFEELVRIMAEHDMKFVKKLYLRSKEL